MEGMQKEIRGTQSMVEQIKLETFQLKRDLGSIAKLLASVDKKMPAEGKLPAGQMEKK